MKHTILYVILMITTAFAGGYEMTWMDRVRELILGLLIMGIPIWIVLAILLPIMLIVKMVKVGIGISKASARTEEQAYDAIPEKKRERLLDALEEDG